MTTNHYSPYVLGAMAYRSGALCPFLEGTSEYVDWVNGYDDQAIEDMDFSPEGLENDDDDEPADENDGRHTEKYNHGYSIGYIHAQNGGSIHDNPFPTDLVSERLGWYAGFETFLLERYPEKDNAE